MSSRALAIVLEPMAHQWLSVGWRVSTSMTTVRDALNQAIRQRGPAEGGGLIHHSDRGSRSQAHLSIRYTERLADAGIDTSVGSVGDSMIMPWPKASLASSGPRSSPASASGNPWPKVEWETLQWVSWYNTERLHSAIGHRPPQEMEDAFYEQMNTLENAA